jgi:hypothetical protein
MPSFILNVSPFAHYETPKFSREAIQALFQGFKKCWIKRSDFFWVCVDELGKAMTQRVQRQEEEIKEKITPTRST